MLTIREYPFGRPLTLVLGASGMTGRRVAQRLWDGGNPIRAGSRFAEPPFDWRNRATWRPALRRVHAVYLSFYPDVCLPGAPATIQSFVSLAREEGVARIVMLSRRGDAGAERSERMVMDSGMDWTILRSSWLSQTFSEGLLVDAVLSGEVSLPVGAEPEPFVDADDVAEVAVEVLTRPGHASRLYELSGPRALTFEAAVAAIAAASRQPVGFESVSRERFMAMPARYRVPIGRAPVVAHWLETVVHGRAAQATDDVRRLLRRAPQAFEHCTRNAFAAGMSRSRQADRCATA